MIAVFVDKYDKNRRDYNVEDVFLGVFDNEEIAIQKLTSKYEKRALNSHIQYEFYYRTVKHNSSDKPSSMQDLFTLGDE